jgi:hypothetical protein
VWPGIRVQGHETSAPLKIREHTKLGPFVEGATTIPVGSYEEMEDLIETGNMNRCGWPPYMHRSLYRPPILIYVHCTSQDGRKHIDERGLFEKPCHLHGKPRCL